MFISPENEHTCNWVNYTPFQEEPLQPNTKYYICLGCGAIMLVTSASSGSGNTEKHVYYPGQKDGDCGADNP